MTQTCKGVQLRRLLVTEIVIPGMSDALEQAEERTERLTLDLSEADADFLARLASYRNVMNALRGATVRQTWSRKAVAEAFLARQVREAREQMADLFREFGSIPPVTGKDDSELRAYAAKVLARVEKTAKKSR